MAITPMEKWKAYYFEPIGDIDVAPFVPRGMHRIADIQTSESGIMNFQVVGSSRWHEVEMFRIRDMNADW